jgi:hypothetical protein
LPDFYESGMEEYRVGYRPDRPHQDAYHMTPAEAARYDADAPTLDNEIKARLGISSWTVGAQRGRSIEIHHPDGYVAQVWYEPSA